MPVAKRLPAVPIATPRLNVYIADVGGIIWQLIQFVTVYRLIVGSRNVEESGVQEAVCSIGR